MLLIKRDVELLEQTETDVIRSHMYKLSMRHLKKFLSKQSEKCCANVRRTSLALETAAERAEKMSNDFSELF
jgi:hypothetical protein